jgi:hypothetical protein
VKYFLGDKIKEYEIGWTFGSLVGKDKFIKGFGWETLTKEGICNILV